MVVVWNLKAKKELRRVYEHILKDSYQSAIKVRQDIINLVLDLPKHPDKYNTDKYKINNDGILKYIITGFHIKSKEIKFVLSSSGIPADHLCLIENKRFSRSRCSFFIPQSN